MPRAALKDLAKARGLSAVAAETRGFVRMGEDKDDIDEDGVDLWADWPCSCVRLRGEPAVVRRAVSRQQMCFFINVCFLLMSQRINSSFFLFVRAPCVFLAFVYMYSSSSLPSLPFSSLLPPPSSPYRQNYCTPLFHSGTL